MVHFSFSVLHQPNPDHGLPQVHVPRHPVGLLQALHREEGASAEPGPDGDEQDERVPLAHRRRPSFPVPEHQVS